MNEYLEIIDEWLKGDVNISIARVIKTWGSAPRPMGSVMMVRSDGKMAGSVSGGCVEGAVVKATLKDVGAQKLNYGVSDDEAWSVGLSCGGSIQVFTQPVDFKEAVWHSLLNQIKQNQSAILISSLENGKNRNTLINESREIIGDVLPEEVVQLAYEAYNQRTHKVVTFDDTEYFIHLFPRKSELLIIGAAHITTDLVALGNQFGFETIVIDPRGYFADNTHFPITPSKLLKQYPSEVLGDFTLDAYTFCAILSHDPKIDDDALKILLPANVAYIGALGSKKTHQKRTNRLLSAGFDQATIDRIAAPIGVPIRAKSAREIALAVMAQIIDVKNKHL